jgi:hypothetical protein
VTADDRTRIVERLAELAAALDARDWAAVGSAFVPDAAGYSVSGRDRITRVVRDHLGGVGPTQHLLGNHRVTVEGDRARSSTYARVYHEGAGGAAGRFFECCGEYEDAWVRVDGEWLITERKFTMSIRRGDFDVLRPE